MLLLLSQNLLVSTNSNRNLLAYATVATAPYTDMTIFLRLGMDFIKSKGTVLYSADGRNWTQLGGQFNIAYDWATGTFQGEQFAVFCYNPQPGAGYLDVDWFRFAPPAFIAGGSSNNQLGATDHVARPFHQHSQMEAARGNSPILTLASHPFGFTVVALASLY